MKIKILIAAGLVFLAICAVIVYYVLFVQVVPDKNGMLHKENQPSASEMITDISKTDD